jgi:hypothetical protein
MRRKPRAFYAARTRLAPNPLAKRTKIAQLLRTADVRQQILTHRDYDKSNWK